MFITWLNELADTDDVGNYHHQQWPLCLNFATHDGASALGHVRIVTDLSAGWWQGHFFICGVDHAAQTMFIQNCPMDCIERHFTGIMQ